MKTRELPPLRNFQGLLYTPGWYRQAGDFLCESDPVDGHPIRKGARVHVDVDGHVHCARHVRGRQ